MKFAIMVITMIFSNIALAYDVYEENSGVKWNYKLQLITDVIVRSQNPLSNKQKNLMHSVYNKSLNKFYEYYTLEECDLGKLDIRIIHEDDLDNKFYFPDEQYARSGRITFGRYYRIANVLYIVSPYLEEYPYWRKYFSHELLHHFYDECGLGFDDDSVEHKEIDRFLYKYGNLFY